MSVSEDSNDDELDSSVLGRHEHWETVYGKELESLRSHGDPGEIWFGELVLLATVKFAHRQSQALGQQEAQARVLDLGTGNGIMAIELTKAGFTDVTGSDYSHASVQLATAVAEKEGVVGIRWVVDDVLESSLQPGFDLIVDKGTLDAIGLRSDADKARHRYRKAVADLLRPNGLLIITSCNSSKNELVCEFTGMTTEGAACPHSVVSDYHGHSQSDNVSFCYVDHVRTYPTFTFGGQEGTRVCTVAFLRR